jgi:hypothetical protein
MILFCIRTRATWSRLSMECTREHVYKPLSMRSIAFSRFSESANNALRRLISSSAVKSINAPFSKRYVISTKFADYESAEPRHSVCRDSQVALTSSRILTSRVHALPRWKAETSDQATSSQIKGFQDQLTCAASRTKSSSRGCRVLKSSLR